MPPNIGWQLAASDLLGSNQTRGHVWLAVNSIRVEVIILGVLHVNQNGVVFGRPAILWLAAVVVGPDDLIQEAFATEQRIEQNLGVMRFAVVEVQIEGAGFAQHAPGLLKSRLEKTPVIGKLVVIAEHR